MLNKVDDYNRNGKLHGNCLLVSFDVINMFPSIDNKVRIESLKNILLAQMIIHHLQNALLKLWSYV